MILGFLVLGLFGLCWYYDRRSGYVYSRYLRGIIGDLIMKVKKKRGYSRELRGKGEAEDVQSARSKLFNLEKVDIEAA